MIKSKNKTNNVLLKKSAISQEKHQFWDSFSETKEITLYYDFFFKSLKTHEIECKMPLYSKKTVILD